MTYYDFYEQSELEAEAESVRFDVDEILKHYFNTCPEKNARAVAARLSALEYKVEHLLMNSRVLSKMKDISSYVGFDLPEKNNLGENGENLSDFRTIEKMVILFELMCELVKHDNNVMSRLARCDPASYSNLHLYRNKKLKRSLSSGDYAKNLLPKAFEDYPGSKREIRFWNSYINMLDYDKPQRTLPPFECFFDHDTPT